MPLIIDEKTSVEAGTHRSEQESDRILMVSDQFLSVIWPFTTPSRI